jgi:hypothetical protein
MDPRERIALWVALVVLLVFVLVRSSSSFVGSQMSFVDLAEFDTLPSDLKKMYYDSMVNGVAKEAGKKVTDMWAALTPDQKDAAKKMAALQANAVIDQIKAGKGGVMVLPPAQQAKLEDVAKPPQGKIAEVKPVQNWMPIAEPVKMQGKIAEIAKPAPGLPPQQQDFIKGMPDMGAIAQSQTVTKPLLPGMQQIGGIAYAQPQKETAMKMVGKIAA